MTTDLPPTPYEQVGPAEPERPGGRRNALIVGGTAVAVAAVGAGAWGVFSFMSGGAQPAQALPADTLAYAAVDLDPSGSQKIAAVRFLNKFPALREELDVDEDDDLRARIFEDLDCQGVSYADDIEPWLGTAVAVAAVDAGAELPSPVLVVEITDEGAAQEGVAALRTCSDDADEVGAFEIADGWLVAAETEDIVATITERAADGTLGDADPFKKWVGQAGGEGVATFYAGPGIGQAMADLMTQMEEQFGAGMESPARPPYGSDMVEELCTEDVLTEDFTMEDCEELFSGNAAPDGHDHENDPDVPALPGLGSPVLPEGYEQQMEELLAQWEDFEGGAAVLRFADESLELEMSMDVVAEGEAGAVLGEGDGVRDTVTSLPDDTLAALAAAVPAGAIDLWFEQLEAMLGPEVVDMMAQQYGLTLPGDLEALFGESFTVALGGDFDVEKAVNSASGADVPVGIKLVGDGEEIEAVLEKIRNIDPRAAEMFGSDVDDDTVAVGPNADYRGQLIEGGNLGGAEVFQRAVPDIDGADGIVFLDLKSSGLFDALTSGDPKVEENLEPLSAFGLSLTYDDGAGHVRLRITTD